MTEHAILQVQPTVAYEAGSTGGPVSPLDHLVELPNNVMEASVVPVGGISDSVEGIPSAARLSLKQDGHATTRLGSKNRDSAPLVSFQLSSHS
jgi:hypothetical protein